MIPTQMAEMMQMTEALAKYVKPIVMVLEQLDFELNVQKVKLGGKEYVAILVPVKDKTQALETVKEEKRDEQPREQ